ncbi:AAA family ATPase [bacterium]|nr:AAA family ATPase [bacterium]
MKLKSLRIENFRAFRDQEIQFDDYTCFVGPNGAGKSTVLMALNVFFRQSPEPNVDLATLTQEDFHKKNTDKPIKITLTFTELTGEEQTEFKHYYRQGQLVVMAKASWNSSTNTAPVTQHGSRMVMADFAEFFEGLENKTSVADLRLIFNRIHGNYPTLTAATTKDAMTDSLQEFEEAHPDLCELRDSNDELYGIAKGGKLQKFIQWVYIPPVKFASDEQTEAKKTAIGQILEKVVRSKISFKDEINTLRSKVFMEYQGIVDGKQKALDDLSVGLCKRLQTWATPQSKIGLKWSNDDNNVNIKDPLARVLVGDDAFIGSLTRLGHGLQRTYLIAVLEELASLTAEGQTGPRLILACEEPELHQHPPQQKHLKNVFEEISEKNNQVMITTHSPYFVSGRAFEHVRVVRNPASTGEATIASTTYDFIAAETAKLPGMTQVATTKFQEARLQQALQPALNEIFFSPIVVLVEGLEDVAYLTSYLIMSGKWTEFRRLGCHIVPVSGKSELPQAIILTKAFKFPCFVIFDCDSSYVEKANVEIPETECENCKKFWLQRKTNAAANEARHKLDNQRIFKALGHDGESAFPPDTLWKDDLIAWRDNIHSALIEDIGKSELEGFENRVRAQRSLQGDGSIKKSELLIGYTIELLYAEGIRSTVLERACDTILAFAKKQTAIPDSVPESEMPPPESEATQAVEEDTPELNAV